MLNVHVGAFQKDHGIIQAIVWIMQADCNFVQLAKVNVINNKTCVFHVILNFKLIYKVILSLFVGSIFNLQVHWKFH
jgi:hypothetical protein